MKGMNILILLCLLLTACSSGMPIATQTATQTMIAPTAAEAAFSSPMPLALTPTFYPSSTPEPSPTLPAPPSAQARFFMSIGEPLYLTSIHMVDEQNGWALDRTDPMNHILRTHDGGHSWKDVTPYYGYGASIYFPAGFFALDANTAWITSPEMPACSVQNWSCTVIPNTALIWHTTDGGNTWQGQFASPIPNNYTPLSMQFLDKQTGWLLAYAILGLDMRYYLLQTTDGGAHWSSIMDVSSRTKPEDPHEKNITAIAFQDSQTAWMSTSEICCEARPIEAWNVYKSTDAGTTWDVFDLPAPEPYPDSLLEHPAQCAARNIQVIQPNILDATIYCYVYEGLSSKPEFTFHYHSPDGGDHWVTFQKTGDVQFIDAMLGWRMTPNEGAYDIERTEDGGVTWMRLKTVQWSGSLHFVNKFVGWALASSNDGTALLHTVDGGRTWEVVSPVVAAN